MTSTDADQCRATGIWPVRPMTPFEPLPPPRPPRPSRARRAFEIAWGLFMSYLGGRKARYATASLPRPSADGRRSPSLAQASQRYLLKHMIIDALEKRLVEALKSVDAHGDIAPAHVHDPMTMLLRENGIRANLMRWDDGRGRYVLTGMGRRRISEGSRAPGAVVLFRNRGVVIVTTRGLRMAWHAEGQSVSR